MDENERMENPQVEETDDGQEGVVDPREEGGAENDGGAGERAEEPDGAGRAADRKPQSREDNAAARAARIRAEQETAQRLREEFDRDIAGMGVTNPYTGKPFGSFAEFRAYGEQYRREKLEDEAKKKGTTVEELEEELENRAFLAKKRQEERARKAAEEEAHQRGEFLRGDLGEFLEAHPEVDVVKLEENQKFRKFAGDRLYRVPLKTLYEDFTDLVGEAERAAVARVAQKQSRSTGGAQSGGAELLTPAQRRELDEWNRANPEMTMTAKEFLG